MSATRLLILGLVRWTEPVHGYDLRRELQSWGAEQWGDLHPGSVYHALKKMAAEGLLAEVDTGSVGKRPARTRYRMTDRGELEFRRLMAEFWWDHAAPAYDPFMVALCFLPALSPQEVAAALRNRMKLLEASVARGRQHTSADWMADKPPHVAEIMELGIARQEAEIAWCARAAERAERGELHPGADVSARRECQPDNQA